jgi:putative redox protein
MEINLKRINDKVLFETTNNTGNSIHIDGTEDIGGENKGMRPMELLLASVAGCSVLDVVNILTKQRQIIDDIQVQVKGDREQLEFVKPYKTIHIHFKLKGNLKEKKVEKAVKISVEKYCSVAASLNPEIVISHSFEIIPNK